ncbi:Protein of unknown function DUF262 [Paenibacillus sp. cl141a]|uniref:DUF262 domain-containing protein n=1 Tax=Paenibacillus sp. cl141a TaxID=1761877 RepID=UPI0008D3C3A6|nr:DUF262 domain-containing protein [Paenibacillus sp. cl141a]SEM24172.1 Protein of unknown function DUF262 [Paenibacillus sp. cl141a]
MIWTPTNQSIADLRDWANSNTLEITPDFQRKEVWSRAAQIMLIDSILKNIPMPKIIVQSIIRDGRIYRKVIDGQQRIKSILSFMRDEYALTKPYEGPYKGKKFSQLPEEEGNQVQTAFLSYVIDFNELKNATEENAREIYSRLNKYNIPLNKQELRRADFPGDFLNLSELKAEIPFFDESRIFTAANSKRMGDVEFISELLAATIEGPQDKKETLDNFYIEYGNWEEEHRKKTDSEFAHVINDIDYIFNEDLKLSNSRFRQKSDFYSLYLAILELYRENKTLNTEFKLQDKELVYLRKDLKMLNDFTAPESDVEFLSEYAIKCVSNANSLSSRKWRKDFLKNILNGTYKGKPPEGNFKEELKSIIFDIKSITRMKESCPLCNEKIDFTDESIENLDLTWNSNSEIFQMSNSIFTHKEC